MTWAMNFSYRPMKIQTWGWYPSEKQLIAFWRSKGCSSKNRQISLIFYRILGGPQSWFYVSGGSFRVFWAGFWKSARKRPFFRLKLDSRSDFNVFSGVVLGTLATFAVLGGFSKTSNPERVFERKKMSGFWSKSAYHPRFGARGGFLGFFFRKSRKQVKKTCFFCVNP